MAVPLPVSEPIAPVPPLTTPKSVLGWNICALVLALAAVAGSLALSLVMGLRACPLCVYERSYVMGAAAVLLVALLTELRSSASVSLLAMTLVVAGLGVAGFHVHLETTGRLECPTGWLGWGTAPKQSLAVLTALFLILAVACLRRPAMIVALIIGGLMAWASVLSAPPAKQPLAPYGPVPIVECRVPYHAPE